MKKLLQIIGEILLIGLLTLLTQIGGIVYLFNIWVCKKVKWDNKWKPLLTFLILYCIGTFVLTPFLAPLFGREPVQHSERIQPANYMTILLNRNYVRPAINELLKSIDQKLSHTSIPINYLDANFPFINHFPLLPHLSHHDGKKLDLSLIYEDKKGMISKWQKSNSGYGVFVMPQKSESNQIRKCLKEGYLQYDYPKYLTFGTKNKALKFSKKGTKKLIQAILSEKQLEKIFIEPHLRERLNLKNKKIRYHGCRAVRHDDHIHLQIY
ncbi:hypothetical protein [Aureispira anguillae]|uniref:Uncharacterized protein n=1 Tax=Aureispira anguillae TaxID=2864201 RepID=A0A915YCC6_9BACT|nr:hypothetical protein [Aureispira anguillae]BDS10438.1 hypothetical protein AsAng_0011460 [Aureispira anguillae]